MSSHDQAAEAPAPPVPVRAYAEQALFDRSPVNLWITAALLYAVLTGAFAAAAALAGLPLTVGPALEAHTRLALVLSLIACVILALQRYSRIRDGQDAAAMSSLLGADTGWAPADGADTRLRVMTGVGLAVGLAIPWLFAPRDRVMGTAAHLPVLIWFTAVSMLLSAMFFRGMELTRRGSSHTSKIVREHLTIDLLRIDQLYPWGRAAARTSLIWFSVSAATLLLFVGDTLSIYTIGLLLVCAGFGVWTFIGTLSLVHHAIRTAKAAELDTVRSQITALRSHLAGDPDACAHFEALLAYEARIAAAPEWPFDQTILVRLGASALILTVPWFGQAIAQLMVERFGHLVR